MGGYGDGLLGEAPPAGVDLYEQQQAQLSQLMMAQQLLQQQAMAAGAGFGGAGDLAMGLGGMNYMHGQGGGGYGGGHGDRKRMANNRGRDRNYDHKRRRQDSPGVSMKWCRSWSIYDKTCRWDTFLVPFLLASRRFL